MGNKGRNRREGMARIGWMVVLFCFLMAGVVGAEEREDYGKFWNNWTDFDRYAYLSGFRDGMNTGWNELERFFHGTFDKDWKPYVEKHMAFYIKAVSKDFPAMSDVRTAMTEIYAVPSNQYLEFSTAFLVSVAKIRGASPESIEELLETARKKSDYQYRMKTKENGNGEDMDELLEAPNFSSMVYKEIYGQE
jgi:hypothetical protein